MSRITDAFADGPALIPYITAGDPDAAATARFVRALAQGGADIIELGLPFSEPIADGPTIQAAIDRALAGGMTPKTFIGLVTNLNVGVPLVAMTYYNIVLQYGEEPVESFVKAAAAAGLDGLIIPDLPLDESDPLRSAAAEHGIDLIFIVAPTTRGSRLERIAEAGSGFLYVQARLGTTGVRTDVSSQTHEALARLTDSPLPKAVGFGVSTGEQAAEIIRAGADGVVAGSVFVDIIADTGRDIQGTADRLEEKTRELKTGVENGSERPEPERT